MLNCLMTISVLLRIVDLRELKLRNNTIPVIDSFGGVKPLSWRKRRISSKRESKSISLQVLSSGNLCGLEPRSASEPDFILGIGMAAALEIANIC